MSTKKRKVLKWYREGKINKADLDNYEAILDEARSVPSGVLKEYYIPNPVRSLNLEEFLEGVRDTVLSLMRANVGYKVKTYIAGQQVGNSYGACANFNLQTPANYRAN